MCDLIKCDFQYKIVHKSISDFEIGEKVFLKSNPDIEMIIVGKSKSQIKTEWDNIDGKKQSYLFIPESILQYKYRGLHVFQDNHDVCVN